MGPAAPARGARAFDATLSVPGREELQQTGMRVRVLPAPAWTPRASREADEAGETNALLRAGAPATSARAREASSEARADGTKKNATEEDALNLDSNLDASSPFAPPPDAWSTPLTPEVLGEMTVIGFWEPGRGLDPLPALHLMAGARGPSARLVGDATSANAYGTAVGVEALHAELSEKMKTAVVSIAGGRREVHLCAIPPTDDSAPDGETATAARPSDDADDADDAFTERKNNGFHFLAFETRAMAPFHHAPILAQKQLPMIFDLDETLLQAFTLSSLDRRAEAIRRAHSEAVSESAERASGDEKTRADLPTDAAGKTVAGALGSFASSRGGADAARVARQRREEDMARLKHDRAMLAQYVAENCVIDNRGRKIAAAAESATTAPGEVTFRPVIRLPSPHCRGGQMIFTRIDPANKGTSMLVHVRPGWEEMYGYLAGLDRRADGERKTQNARCAAFVCTMSESQYAQEMWRLLDPRGALIAPKDLAHRVVSVKQGAELKTLEKAVGSWGIAKELCVVLDDRTAVWEPRARPHILAVAPFMPYATDTGPGLRGEAPGEAGVLGAARRMLEKTRMDLFMTYERFAKFHAKFPNAPFEPPAGSLTRRDADNSAVSESVRDTEPFFKTSRPQPPDVSETLPPLMNAHAKEAARAVAQMGGAARSAAGAGSRLNAMLGGIAAPRVAGAVKTLASASFVKNAGGEIRGAGEHEKRDPGIPPESGAGAGDDAREKAAAAAAAAMKLAAEKKARERAERETKNVPAGDAAGDGDNDGDNELSGPGVDSDEERVRKEDADAEAALGESSESDAEPDARTKASARAPGDASAKATNGAEKEAPRKRRYACSTCAAHDLTPTDHFRFGKACPFHPEYKAQKPTKDPEDEAKKPEKKKQTQEETLLEAQRGEQEAEREPAKTPSASAPAMQASSSSDSGSGDIDSDRDSHDSAEGGGSNKKGGRAVSNAAAAAKGAAEPMAIKCVMCGRDDGREHMVECSNRYHGKKSTPCLSNAHWQCLPSLTAKPAPESEHEWFCGERCEKWHEAGEAGLAAPEEDDAKRKTSGASSPEFLSKPVRGARKTRLVKEGGDAGNDGSERDEGEEAEGEDAGDDATAGKRKRRDEKAWSPPPEVTAESEIPAAKPSPSKPNAKKQKVSQKSQREAMLKKLSGKRR